MSAPLRLEDLWAKPLRETPEPVRPPHALPCSLVLDAQERAILDAAVCRRRARAALIYGNAARAADLVAVCEELLVKLATDATRLELDGAEAHQARRALHWALAEGRQALAEQLVAVSQFQTEDPRWRAAEAALPRLRAAQALARRLGEPDPPTTAAIGPRLRTSPLGA